jgi:hypothetical protein
MDLRRKLEFRVVVSETLDIELYEFTDSESGIVHRRHDGLVALLQVVGSDGIASRAECLDLGGSPILSHEFGNLRIHSF